MPLRHRAWAAKPLRFHLLRLALAVLFALPAPALAWYDPPRPIDGYDHLPHDGVHITDGSYVMNAGELQVNITNWGLIGSKYSWTTPYSDSPSAQWPAGSGLEYLWAAGLWVGGVVLGQSLVSTGEFDEEFRPLDNLEDTIYEAVAGQILRPPGNVDAGGLRQPSSEADDDGDGRVDEETLNGYDDDGDGLIDEDFGQIGNQMMVCTMYDNTRLAQELYNDHEPLNLKVVQKAFAWEGTDVHDFIAFEFEITNIGAVDIENVYVGFFADCDIGPRGEANADDDMAGYFGGLVRARDGSYVEVSVGYMYDANEDNPLPGYIGILFLGEPGSPFARIRSYQNFTGERPYEDGGDPSNDVERYELMSLLDWDNNTRAGDESDFRFLISAGPVAVLAPERTLRFQAAIVMGNGLFDLLRNCAEAAITYQGGFFDLDDNSQTGVHGRETKTCLEWWPINPQSGESYLYDQVADFMDRSCVGPNMPFDVITADDLYVDEHGLHCIWVNMDNCQECNRRAGDLCAQDNALFENYWDCNDPRLPAQALAGCTGVGGAESQVNWLVGMAPPPPNCRIWEANNSVHVFWDDLSEVTKDYRVNEIDFESYRIWRADNWDRPFGSSLENGPNSNLWRLIAEYDVINHFYERRILHDGRVIVDTIPLGYNTGLAGIVYRPICLDDDRFEGLQEAMQEVVDADSAGAFIARPFVRDSQGHIRQGMEGLAPWESYPAVLDTFFWVTARDEDLAHGIRGKRAVRFYEFVDRNVHNGFIYFYAVTATDHELDFSTGWPRPSGGGLSGDPGTSYTHAVPGTQAQTAADRERYGVNIYVYPNPATPRTLAEFQQLYPNADDPTGLRIMFANLPRAHNTIKIFTLDGDLVAEIDHDGTTGYGMASWNLVSRNGQQVVSGVYLYAVQSQDSHFEDTIGKFVIVR
jgi:hypothetical protein